MFNRKCWVSTSDNMFLLGELIFAVLVWVVSILGFIHGALCRHFTVAVIAFLLLIATSIMLLMVVKDIKECLF